MTQPTIPARLSETEDLQRRRYQVSGRVQGVGFRPFVYRLAVELRLAGCVANDPRGALIEVEGPGERLDAFLHRLRSELPPLACIHEIRCENLTVRHESDFRILPSLTSGLQDAEITPDVAVCEDCLRELFDPGDRRYRYPFINCTNCGPRYSIIEGVPYDRPNTTMRRFRMCPACQAEYDDPASRRFHAQPNACPDCGPRLWLADAHGRELSGDPVREGARLLMADRILAIKGIGGFHLACRADREEVVLELRRRKGRETKPLAVMVADLRQARRFVEIFPSAEHLLGSPARPIVLLPRRPVVSRLSESREGGDPCDICPSVAPGLDQIGIMLPYAPLHYLLFAEGLPPLVMTSANPSDEPLCCDNREAAVRLAGIADAFLMHDRDIARRVDDSVIRMPAAETPIMIRRARGYAPAPVEVGEPASQAVLATGPEMKATICLLTGRQAVLSEHLGDLSNAEAYRHFLATVARLQQLLGVTPEVVACDLHPDYASTRFADTLGRPVVRVQHHHAHVVACMAERRLEGEVIGIACDGTGYGPDGTIWGGEILRCSLGTYRRMAHLACFPLLGGDAGARQTWRPAAGLLSQAAPQDWTGLAAEAFARVPAEALDAARRRLARGHNLPRTSSLGRLFDAVAFLLGVCDDNHHEAQAAMELEALAARGRRDDLLAEALPSGGCDAVSAPEQIPVAPLVLEMLKRRHQGAGIEDLALSFHAAVATIMASVAVQAARTVGLDRAVLTGGCMVNHVLTTRMRSLLEAEGLRVFVHECLPCGDGGVALGQAVAAAHAGQRID